MRVLNIWTGRWCYPRREGWCCVDHQEDQAHSTTWPTLPQGHLRWKQVRTQVSGGATTMYWINADSVISRTYSAIASQVAKSGYRSDLRAQSIARASAILQSQKPVKTNERVTKLRGAKAKKAAAEKEA